MTPRHLAFVREYLLTMNATQAMVRAGYSARTANRHAWRLMRHPQVKRLIEAALADRDRCARIEATETLENTVKAAKGELQAVRDALREASQRINSAQTKVYDVEWLVGRPNRRALQPPAPAADAIIREHPPEYAPAPANYWPEGPGQVEHKYDPLEMERMS